MTWTPTAAPEPRDFLAANDIVQSEHPAVVALAGQLRSIAPTDEAFTQAAFTWVRDEVAHSVDAQDARVTLTAPEVLEQRVGLCYAKSHLLAALLRSQGVPTALSYQLLADGDGLVLHGLVAVHLRGGWHRQDARGHKAGVDAQFSLDEERLAWSVDAAVGERDGTRLFAAPAQSVVDALRGADDVLALAARGLPSSLPDEIPV